MQFSGFISALLFGVLAAAAPMNVVWVTETDVDVVTVPMTRTVWVNAGDASSTVAPPSTWTTLVSSSTSSSSVYIAPSTSSSSSVYVAPTSSSSSVYVAPTTSSSSSVYVAPTTSSSSVWVAPTTSSSSVWVAPTTSSSSIYVAPTTSSTSVYVAPTTSSSSVYVAPTTSSSVSITASVAADKIAQSTTSSAAAASSSSSSSSSYASNGLTGIAAAGQSYTGDLTWYETGSGACGWDNTASDHIVAISEIVFDNPLYATANPNNNPLCGQYVSITGKDGTAYQAKVVDRCTGCAAGDLDLSEDFFNIVTSNGDGRVSNMEWVWL